MVSDKQVFVTEEVHKTLVTPGDLILHNGAEMTVCRADITRGDFFGVKIFGDSYWLGYQLFKILKYNDPMRFGN